MSDTQATTTQKKVLKLGYFKLRGRAQVPRLLLEFLGIPYEDVLFNTMQDWNTYKQSHMKEWPLISLPYLIDGDVLLTETVPICYYILNKYNGQRMLGSSLQEISTLQQYCWSIDTIGVGLTSLLWAQGPQKELEEKKERFWNQHVQEKMYALQAYLGKKSYMFGSGVSLFDFSIYELIHYVGSVFPIHLKSFPRLLALESRVAKLPAISQYENSKRAIKQLLPNPTPKINRRVSQ